MGNMIFRTRKKITRKEIKVSLRVILSIGHFVHAFDGSA